MNEQEEQQQRREECRQEVRAYLAERTGIALSAEQIQRGLMGRFTLTEVRAALAYLESEKHVLMQHHRDGATKYFQVTSEGIRVFERG